MTARVTFSLVALALVAAFAATLAPAFAAKNCGSGGSAWNGLSVTDVRVEGVGCPTGRKVAHRAHFDSKAVQTRVAGRVWACVITKAAAPPVASGDHHTRVRCRGRGDVVRFSVAS